MGKLNLNTAEGTRVELTKKQKVQVERLYKRVSRNIAKEAERLPKTPSGSLRQYYLKELQEQVDDQLKKIGQELEGIITENMSQAARAVVDDNLKFLQSVGLPIQGAFSHVPDEVVRSLVSGKLYEGNWTLSKAIWGETEKAQKDVRTVIAEGVAQNKSAYDIAKDLEKYVNPSARKDWDWSKVYPGTNKKVDYSAQRLARTLVSHAYQQSFVKTTQRNPFVTKYRWMSSNSSRVCEICAARDGRLFDKNDLPLDHPNGMCTFEAVMEDSMIDIADRIGDWVNGKDDPALDEYVKSLFPGKDIKTGVKRAPVTPKRTPFDGQLKEVWIYKNLSNLRKNISSEWLDSFWDATRDKLNTLNETQLRWLAQGNSYLKKMVSHGSEAWWSYQSKTICIDLRSDIMDLNNTGAFSTLFHEYGHLLDYKLGAGGSQLSGTKSWGKPFYKLLEKEYNRIIDKNGGIPMGTKVGLAEDDCTSGVQDIIDGLSQGKNRIRWGHGKEYWTRKLPKDQWKEVTSEAFAHMNSAYINPDNREVLIRYFPESYEYFVKEVEKHVGVL